MEYNIMAKRKATPLQKAFAKSKLKKRAIIELMQYEDIPAEYTGYIQAMFTEAFLMIDDAQIRKTLNACKELEDTTKAQRREIEKLLQL